MAVEAATVGDIVRYNDAPTRTPLQSALALAVALWVLLISGEVALSWSDRPDDHPPHAVVTSVVDEFAAIMDHPHLQAARTALSPDNFAMAVAPRVATTLVALGLAVAAVALGTYCGHWVWATIRGPPPEVPIATPGRQLLARFCIARR
jgi:hypothetical protein